MSFNSLSNDKVRCDYLTKSLYEFHYKLSTVHEENNQIISPYVKVDDIHKDFLSIDDKTMDVCEYINTNVDEIISYLIYSGSEVFFINKKALGSIDSGQGVIFRYIKYDKIELKIYFESSGGGSEDYSSYDFYFLPYQNDFFLQKVIKRYNIKVSDGFDLAKKEIMLPDTYLSKFNFESFLETY